MCHVQPFNFNQGPSPVVQRIFIRLDVAEEPVYEKIIVVNFDIDLSASDPQFFQALRASGD